MKIEEGKKGSVSNIEFELPTPILEAVKNPEMYVKLDLFILRGLRSKYSSALYEALKDYQNLNSIRVEIEVLRKLMGVGEKQYSVFTMFKKRVLDRAISEINEKTDISIQYELERAGRKVEAVIFSVSSLLKQATKEEVNQELVSKLKDFGIKDYQIKELLQKHEVDYILANVSVVEQELEKGKNIRNVAAYLMKAFVVDFRPTKPRIQVEKEEKKVEEQAQKKAEEQQLARLKKQFEKDKKRVVEEHLNQLSSSEIEELKAQFLQQVEQSDFLAKVYHKKGFEYHTIQAARHKFLAPQIFPPTLMDFEAYRAVQGENGER
ncbi:MAG: replication initiation protein [Bacteroidota bacterium]